MHFVKKMNSFKVDTNKNLLSENEELPKKNILAKVSCADSPISFDVIKKREYWQKNRLTNFF